MPNMSPGVGTEEGEAVNRASVLMHQVMLSDRERLAAYEQALAQAVRPGDVVADLGAGTLILSWLALRHGAGHVYAIEGDPETANMARAIAHHNELQDKITIVTGDARIARLPTQPTVVVGEMMGNLGPEEEMAETFAAFVKHNCTRPPTIVPNRLLTHLALIDLRAEGWGIWSSAPAGLDLSVVQQHIAPHAQLHFFIEAPHLLSEPAVLLDQPLGPKPTPLGNATISLPCTTDGTVNAVVGYFTADLSATTSLSNFPTRLGSNWGAWIWPLPPTPLRAGDTLDATLLPPSSRRDVDTWRLDCQLKRGVH